MTMDGGLERLVRILHDFCICPPPPENPSILYGLSPPNARPPKPVPTLNPQSFDKHAAYRFSLAFQCVVNIGVRGSEDIRGRVVQAGTLDVVGCILEAWLANKGFAVGPSSSATGMPRETREQRMARRQVQAELRQREEAAELARALHMQIAAEHFWRVERAGGRGGVSDDIFDEQMAEVTADIPAPTDLGVIHESSPPPLPLPGPVQALSTVPVSLTPPISDTPTTAHDAEDADTSTDTSTNATPVRSGTPTGAVLVPGRERSGTVVGRPIWDHQPAGLLRHHHLHRHQHRQQQQHNHQHRARQELTASPSGGSTDNSQPNTETEDDGDIDMDRDRDEGDPSPIERGGARGTRRHFIESPHHLPHHHHRTRRAVGIVSDTPPTAAPLEVSADAHIIINDAQGGVVVRGGDGGVGVGGVEDGIVSLETNDDFAMGAPPGAPGAIDDVPGGGGGGVVGGGGVMRRDTIRNWTAPDATPRAGTMDLPMMTTTNATTAPSPVGRTGRRALHQDTAASITPTATIRGAHRNTVGSNNTIGVPNAAATTTIPNIGTTTAGTPGVGGVGRTSSHHHHHHYRDTDSGPYRDEDVLLSLQLLAYLSKYPHVRQAFYQSRTSFHPASANLPGSRSTGAGNVGAGTSSRTAGAGAGAPFKEPNNFFRAFSSTTSRGKEKASCAATSAPTSTAPPATTTTTTTTTSTPSATRQTNVFSLVERFTFRPSSTETDLPNPPPKLPPEIQYWAGVIMRNACRKDDSRGGIRQCANMLCGRWESYPREFAKCRRCRKAKYCGKECQSTAWSEGHRFWCSAKEGDDDAADPADHNGHGGIPNPDIAVDGEIPTAANLTVAAGGPVTGRAERRAERERERHSRERALAIIAAGSDVAQAARITAFRNTHNNVINPASPATTIPFRAGGTAANRPLLAPPPPPPPTVSQWANINRPPPPTLPQYLRDDPDSIGPPPPAPGVSFNPYHRRQSPMSPTRRRAETMSAAVTGLPETSRYFPGVHVSENAGPSSRGRRRRGIGEEEDEEEEHHQPHYDITMD